LINALLKFHRAALGATQDPDLIKDTFSLMMESRSQDMATFFRGIAANYKFRRELAKFFIDNYKEVSLCLRIIARYV
jgi:hypothetical protein